MQNDLYLNQLFHFEKKKIPILHLEKEKKNFFFKMLNIVVADY